MPASSSLTIYTPILLDDFRHLATLSSSDVFTQISSLFGQYRNEPIELIGDAPLAVAGAVYAYIADRAPEVIYRSRADEQGFVIFSTLDPGEFYRPATVVIPEWLSDISETRNRKLTMPSATQYMCQMNELWQQVMDESPANATKTYYSRVARLPRVYHSVDLVGEIPLLPFLYTVDWFLPFAQALSYHSFIIHQHSLEV